MLTRAEKERQLQLLSEKLRPAEGLFVVDFRGLKVAEITELRRKVREAEGQYLVVKNTLAKIAVAGSDKEEAQKLFVGPSAVAFTNKDVVALAKVLAEFAKTHEKLRLRGALVEGTLLDEEGAKQVAAMPSKQELVARLLFLLQSPMRRLAVALQWPVRSLALTVKQIADSRKEN
ncbi:MAG: 50S ribosomal protein L10 [Thermoanaerobaculaceae bacterium]